MAICKLPADTARAAAERANAAAKKMPTKVNVAVRRTTARVSAVKANAAARERTVKVAAAQLNLIHALRGPTLGRLFPPLIVHNSRYKITGAGIGLRRVIAKELNAEIPKDIDFFELAPENWINVGGKPGRQLTAFCEQRPIMAHGLSLHDAVQPH